MVITTNQDFNQTSDFKIILKLENGWVKTIFNYLYESFKISFD